MKAIKIFSALLAGLIICLFNIARVSAQSDESEAEPELVTDAKSAILIEPTTLAVIYEKNADDRRHPASMTKIMTMILIMEAVKKGVISFSDTLYASEYASSMGGTNIYLEPGEGMNAEDLFKSIAINSANDSAVVFAEAIGGSVNNFVRMMNNKAKEIGCTATTFKNPHGLPEAGHLSTARDMALMGAYLVNNHRRSSSTASIGLRPRGYRQTFLARQYQQAGRFVEGVDGIKTGWTNEAGYCLTATIKRDNKRFIAVVMGGSSAKVRNQEIMQMLNYALGTYEVHNIFKKDQVVATYEDVSLYPMRYNVVITTDVNVLLKKGEQLKDISVEKTIDYKNLPYDNKKVGTIKIYYDGELIKEVELAVQEEVRKASFIKVFWEVLKEILLVSK